MASSSSSSLLPAAFVFIVVALVEFRAVPAFLLPVPHHGRPSTLINLIARPTNPLRAVSTLSSPPPSASPPPPWEEEPGIKFRKIMSQYGINSMEADAIYSNGVLEYGVVGDRLIMEGPEEEAVDRQLYLILRGSIRIEVRGSRVAKLGEGDFLGEASFVSDRKGPRSVTAICSGDFGVVYMRWPRAKLKAFLSRMPDIQTKLNDALIQQLSRKLVSTMNTYERASSAPVDPSLLDQMDLKYGADYGFRNASLTTFGAASDPLAKATPGSAFKLAIWNFNREYQAIRRSIRFGEFAKSGKRGGPSSGSGWDPLGVVRIVILKSFGFVDKLLEKAIFPVLRPSKAYMSDDPKVINLQGQLQLLTLSNEAITERERVRRQVQEEIVGQGLSQGVGMASKMKQSETPWFILGPYFALCTLLDVMFEERPLARFWFLETVARMPYFSYISMLHLYETLGWWSVGADVRKVHFAEEWNEMHHLNIMESLGGDTRWFDRFFARHAAIIYYWLLNIFFLISPRLAYNFSELIESHAVDTYSQFVEENEPLLKSLPPPKIAIEYYMLGDHYMFDEFQTARKAYSRRPVIRSLYDVFCAIRDDELEHVRTVNQCQISDDAIISPNTAAANAGWAEEADEEDEEALEQKLELGWWANDGEDDPFDEGRGWDEQSHMKEW